MTRGLGRQTCILPERRTIAVHDRVYALHIEADRVGYIEDFPTELAVCLSVQGINYHFDSPMSMLKYPSPRQLLRWPAWPGKGSTSTQFELDEDTDGQAISC